MKTVLVILTQANLSSLQVHESLSATMVLATFGSEVKVLLQDAALSLLKAEIAFDPLKQAFKLASNMVDSFDYKFLLSRHIKTFGFAVFENIISVSDIFKNLIIHFYITMSL